MSQTLRAFGFASALLGLSACGGGSGSSPEATGNRAPIVSSSAQVSIDENTSGTLYTLTVSDPDGDAVSASVVPGGDEDAFDIDLTSLTVSSTEGFDFEMPTDGNGDNVYTITFEIRDSSGLTVQFSVDISILDVAEDLALRRVGSGFNQPLFLIGLPGSSDVLVLEKGGRIRLLDPDTGLIDTVDFLDVSPSISAAGEGGLLGFAFSPDFASDRAFYVNVTNPSGDTEIRRYLMFTGSSSQADPSTADIILTFAQPDTNHNAGWIGFSEDNLLFVPTGDGGGSGDPSDFAQNPNSLLGKVLRIDVSTDAFPSDPTRDYAIPAGNAFDGTNGREEIFALGLRNPYRASFDSVTGDLFLADVGQGAVEEINRLRSGDVGANYGWNEQEGTQDFEGPDQAAFTDPVAEYFHGSGPTQGNSITGGYVHRGGIDAIQDHYVFADFSTENIWAVPVDDLIVGQTVSADQFVRLNEQLVPDAGTLASISSFGEDEAGNLYIVGLNGDVFRIEEQP
ncbi:MAG: PQQ-dependent sugar dehydrogenase [Henriciella sp.]|nr:PQQ-dependent sugar dehydrogenase [Henriciella sp.]